MGLGLALTIWHALQPPPDPVMSPESATARTAPNTASFQGCFGENPEKKTKGSKTNKQAGRRQWADPTTLLALQKGL